jgi:hypothetical protein
MPRGSKVAVSYQKVRKKTSIRANIVKAQAVEMKRARGLTPLAQYIEDNRESGLSVVELTEQFQEFDCDHLKAWALGKSPDFTIQHCPDCGLIEKVDGV